MKNFMLIFSIFLLIGCEATPGSEDVDYEDDVKPLIETDEKPVVRGSCNVADKGTCVDFVGSLFTEERMKLSCTEGKFSFDACPYPELGGCQFAPGTISESIAWSYSPITAEDAVYQEKACNALSMSKWVRPEDLLNR